MFVNGFVGHTMTTFIDRGASGICFLLSLLALGHNNVKMRDVHPEEHQCENNSQMATGVDIL